MEGTTGGGKKSKFGLGTLIGVALGGIALGVAGTLGVSYWLTRPKTPQKAS